MKITNYKRNSDVNIRLTSQEIFWLKTILSRYNERKGCMTTPPNGFPVELQTKLDYVCEGKVAKK